MTDKVTKVMSKKRQNTAQRIIKALYETQGLLTMAARRAGVTYKTVNCYVHDYPSVAEAVHYAKESMLDFTEGKLFEKIKDGDTASILFFLKTQGKKRGYVERQEVTGEDGKALIERSPTIITLEDGGVFIPPPQGNGYDPALIAEN